MSAPNWGEKLQDELVCAICLEPFKDPVILDCGHSYCQACITGSWGAWGTGLCPQCRKPLPEAELRPNKQVEAVVGIARRLEGQCKKHRDDLKLFCKEDRTLICRVCRESREHRAHTVIPIEAAAEEFKEQLLSHRARVQRVRDERGGRAAAEEGKYRILLKQLECQKQESLSEIKQVRQVLKQREQLLRDPLEGMIQDLGKTRNKSTNRRSEGLLHLDNLIAEINQKCQQPAIELFKDIDSTLSRCEQVNGEEEAPVDSLTEVESRVQALSESQTVLRDLLENFRVELAPELGPLENISSEVQGQVSGEDPTEDVPDSPKQEDTSVCLLDWEDDKLNSDSCQKQEAVPTERQNNVTDFINVEPEGDVDAEYLVSEPVPDISFMSGGGTLNLLDKKRVGHRGPGHWFDSKLRRRGAWKIVAAVVASVLLLAVLLTAVIAWSASKASVTPPDSPATCCPEEWIGYQGKCYLFSEDEANWTSSQLFCSSHGASLAWLDTRQEKDFLMRHKGYLDPWISLRREPGQPWKWPNGSVFNHPVETGGGGGECAYMYQITISSSECYRRRNWICSKPDEFAKRKIA
ncbi:E3 ubiquitin-protein ligase TRIM11-like isoform X2 [Mauremys reevesii]|uniref:E3 ubiquitin-protein ligase TRIM11-like isoform X2 n=1 Tax=Mauremys reevesii TaxID=260615 RepID=UPI00193FCECE|nr:E3 ubiquitin-protein ligase TRIM11-like isoform X2 [Mauremys reevesii]